MRPPGDEPAGALGAAPGPAARPAPAHPAPVASRPLPRTFTLPSWLKPLGYAGLYANLLLLGLMSAVYNVGALLLLPLLPRAPGRRWGRAGIAHGYRLYWWLASLTGMLRIDNDVLAALKDERGLIVVSNHPGMLDALLLVARLPRSFCIMKAGLVRNPFLGSGARLARYIRNDSAGGMLRLAVDELRQGGQLVIFPEGTRTERRPMNAFKPVVTLISKQAGAPIQTVFIDTDSPFLGKGWPIWRLPPLPIAYRVRLGQRFAPARDTLAALHEVEHYMAAHVHAAPLPLSAAAADRVPPAP